MKSTTAPSLPPTARVGGINAVWQWLRKGCSGSGSRCPHGFAPRFQNTGRGLFKAHAFTQAHSCGSSGGKTGIRSNLRALLSGLQHRRVRSSRAGPIFAPYLHFVCSREVLSSAEWLGLRGIFLGLPLAKSSVQRSLKPLFGVRPSNFF